MPMTNCPCMSNCGNSQAGTTAQVRPSTPACQAAWRMARRDAVGRTAARRARHQPRRPKVDCASTSNTQICSTSVGAWPQTTAATIAALNTLMAMANGVKRNRLWSCRARKRAASDSSAS